MALKQNYWLITIFSVREEKKELDKQYDKSENDLKALQSVGQIVGEVLKQLTEEKFIVKATNGPRYVVGCRRQLDKCKLKVKKRTRVFFIGKVCKYSITDTLILV